MPSPLIEVVDLVKSYPVGDAGTLEILHGLNFTIDAGEFVAIMGPSGSGKSTLMNILGCLDVPSGGRYVLNGTDTAKLDPDQLAALRNRTIGFVFQGFNLLPRKTVEDNVALPLLYAGVSREEREARAVELLRQVGLGHRIGHKPPQLSGGQQQRVAIVRALAMQPEVMLFDEITSALDPQLVGEVLDVLLMLKKQGMTMVMATHEMGFAREAADKICFLDSGRIIEEGPPEAVFDHPSHQTTQAFLARALK